MYIARPPLDSPAGSEISVGGAPSPSPKIDEELSYSPPNNQTFLRLHNRDEEVTASPSELGVLPKEKPKSFSIADILGRDGATEKEPTPQSPPATKPLSLPKHQQIFIPSPILAHPWDNLRGGIPPAAFTHFIPPSAAQLYAGAYDPRFTLDYHRKLEEHFNVQAQILRQMTMVDSSLVPPPPPASSSECGSERSMSVTSNCCSPSETNSQKSDCSPHQEKKVQVKDGQKTDANGTPLDKLFQMTSKNFDESQGEFNIFCENIL